MFDVFFSPRSAAALAIALLVAPGVPAPAQAPATGTISGSVGGNDGAAVAGASVDARGPAHAHTTTDAKGTFVLSALPPGTYALSIVKGGFETAEESDVVVTAGATASVRATLVPASFSSLREIGRVSTNDQGRSRINTSSAAIDTISSQVFVDQGQLQVTKVLNETPGIITTRTGPNSGSGNGASEGLQQLPQIRGALPYETESLIDGHPVSVGASSGSFTPIFLNPALLQNVEVVKGPGALSTDINYSIGGSVNYRTLEPTRTLQESVDLGIDGYGGTFGDFKITGSEPSHFLDYAFAYATDGTPGPLNGYKIAGSQVPLTYGSASLNADGTGNWYVNGRGYAGIPEGLGASSTPQYAGIPGEAYFNEPIYVCCSTLSTQFLQRAELAKLRFNFSQQTALTVSYLGGQNVQDATGAGASSVSPIYGGGDFSTFVPPAGYTGSVPAGAAIPFDLDFQDPQYQDTQQGLFQTELRTALGKSTLLARYYTAASNQFEYNYLGPHNLSFSGNAYGGAALCPVNVSFNFGTGACSDGSAPVTTFFNGQSTTFTSGDESDSLLRQDHSRGYSAEFDIPSGDNLFSLAYDTSHHDSIYYEYVPIQGVVGYQLPPGSGQQFTTILGRGSLQLTPRLTTTISDYQILYSSHYTGDGGVTWNDSTNAFNAPRLAVAWRPNQDVALRFSAGSSIAPPYISLLSAPAQVPQPNSVPATYYTLNENNGQLKPETAFGYDLGIDKRVGRDLVVSSDAYLTNLHDEFLPSTYQNGTYSGAGTSATTPLPLYVTQTQNLGFARYYGIELTLDDAPATGAGFLLEGDLQRAYPYDLPAGFYNTAAGPYTTNLAVLPGQNFQPTGIGYNGLGYGRVPYSSGYGEINYRDRHGLYANLGVTYYGPNNTYDEPAFGVVSASVRIPVGKGATFQLSGDNLTGAFDQPFYGYFSGTPITLANAGTSSMGYLGATDGGNYGPFTLRATLHYSFGH